LAVYTLIALVMMLGFARTDDKFPVEVQADPEWEIIQYKGRPYVKTESLKDYYNFDSYESTRGNLFFKRDDLLMKMQNGSQEVFIKGTKFFLSHRIVFSNGYYLISWRDLNKFIDPVMRPNYVQRTRPFETVVIDAGHGGNDTGSKGYYGDEHIHTLRLAKILEKELIRRGLRVKMTRTEDVFVPLPSRVIFANTVPNSIFVSLHFNNNPARSASGVETFALSPHGAEATNDGPDKDKDKYRYRGNRQDSANIALATAVHSAVMHKVTQIDRGVRRDRWEVLTGLNQPGILFEGGFITNRTEAKLIAKHEHLEKLAYAIADGIMNYRRAAYR